MGVQLGRAGTFLTIGLILGVAFGGGLAAVLSAARLPAHDAQVADIAAAAAFAQAAQAQAQAQAAALPTALPSQAIGSTGGSNGTGSTQTIPGVSASALSQALVLDTRLADSTAAFEAALAAPKVNVEDVSQLLRNASADAAIGLQLAQQMNAWSAGTAVSDHLATFYTAVQSVAAEGLGSSIRNEAAYRASATAMTKLLAGLGPIDTEARQLASSSGINLPAANPVR
jgi:hypothetical protein